MTNYINSNAINRFLQDRQYNDRSTRLIKKKGQIHLVEKKNLSLCTRFKAQLGCGNASFRKISVFVSKHQNSIFISDDKTKSDQLKQDFNKFVDHYNKNRAFWKTAKKIKISKSISSQAFKGKISEIAKEMTIEQSKAYLDEISERHRNIYLSECPLRWLDIFLTLNNEFTESSQASVRPDDHQLSNLILECQRDEEAYFLPSNSLQGASSIFAGSLEPSIPEQLNFLTETFRAAFISGKKLVVVRFGNDIHTVAAGFSSNGDFKIIDSMMNGTVNIKALTTALNQAGIKNDKRESIQFHGEYVNTRIQRGGHECIRFATLYCYHMYQEKNLEAFAEVNGAFLEGKLQSFEDYKNIAGAKSVRIVNTVKADYANFMRSWAYRTQGLSVDKWEDIPIKMIKHVEDCRDMQVYSVQKDLLPKVIGCTSLLVIDQEMNEQSIDHLQEIPIGADDTLGSLTRLNEKRVLIFEENRPFPRLYRLLPGQKLFTVDWQGERESIDLPYVNMS